MGLGKQCNRTRGCDIVSSVKKFLVVQYFIGVLSLIGILIPWSNVVAENGMNARGESFGRLPDGTEVLAFLLNDDHGVKARILTYGGIIQQLLIPDRHGVQGDVVLGFDDLGSYVERNPYFGTITGRVANRIAKGAFSLDGASYQLAINNGPNHLHGGLRGFDKVVWQVLEYVHAATHSKLSLRYVSPDGDQGYPGVLTTTVTYVVEKGALSIAYDAETTKATPVNLTSHSYFNLRGSGDIREHQLRLNSEFYTPVDATLIPTGEILPVAGTTFDFLTSKPIGRDLGAVEGGGYDHNFVVKASGGGTRLVAHVEEPESGRVMEIYSTEPGVQLYTGNFLDGSLRGKAGIHYEKHSGFCLETQHFPDAVHHQNFPSIVLKPGEHFHSETVHRFSVLSKKR